MAETPVAFAETNTYTGSEMGRHMLFYHSFLLEIWNIFNNTAFANSTFEHISYKLYCKKQSIGKKSKA